MSELFNESLESSIDFSQSPQLNSKPDWWNDDGHGWQDTFTARQRIFADGQAEIVISKEKFFISREALALPPAKRGKSEKRERNDEDASRRAKKNVRLCCKEIRADRMITLTYRENMTDRDLALKHLKAFARRVGKVAGFHYVAVIEQQERGAIHFHIAVHGRQSYVLVRSIWQSIVGVGEGGQQMGQANVRDPHKFGFGKNGANKLASYIAKYVGKKMDSRELNQKRYFRSRGIVLPEVNTWRISSTDMLGAVQTAFAIAAEFGLEGVQTWCNNALGVVWIATAPRSGPLVNACPF
ncbi:rolling circle replication-associated protein [Glaciimonas immobilis]|uniref:Replication-associated protein ORF2/G2P domain-containing protein n=1 Tax=Glaciimonas immobilis TaxID=728004 RepID=A0A840RR49_9BURK|nr:hypothetical protein [Glaciimonas immobilis]KAF3999450.1 hypothetical protein HAV38_05900 [Glaciimonas immobilis]MBB5198959.1 hypothetical protein [Glaciimonas immobilis]